MASGERDNIFNQLLVYLFAGTRGAEMMMRIVLALTARPLNINELSITTVLVIGPQQFGS